MDVDDRVREDCVVPVAIAGRLRPPLIEPGGRHLHHATTRIRDPEILRDLRGWLLTQSSKLDRALTELRRMGSGHLNILAETTIVASCSMSANPGEAQPKMGSDQLKLDGIDDGCEEIDG